MSSFVNYVCWTDAGVLASAPRDAASFKAGHFQAVHHPLRAKRGRLELGRDPDGTRVEEQDVTDALRSAIGPDGYLLIPVVGGSGTGKSHLVRWVYEHTRESPGWVTRYLAKNRTSIRHVVELVLEGMRGPAIDAAREALESAPAYSESDETLGQRLLDELALVVAEEPVSQSGVERRDAQLRERLRRSLPDIFRDPVVRRRFTSTGAVIPRLVGLARKGRQDDDGLDDDAMRVHESDLPLNFDAIADVTPEARKTLLNMSNLPDLRRVAIEVINDALPRAVKRIFLSNNIDLVAVFREVRREMGSRGQELVLFIEDLTVLHGVEGEFLDAIVEPASSLGGELCNLRVLFAITRGHFDSLDTVRTRCSDAYWLDSTYGPNGVEPEEAVSFLGRYLNACRLEPQKLESDWAERTEGTFVANACSACDHRDICHESFGASSEGYGLYPFNRVAIDRLISCLSAQRFDPRQVVKALIEKFLPLGARELESAIFPSETLMADFHSTSIPVRAEIEQRLQHEHGGEADLLVTLLRYWSEDRETIAGSILTSFGNEDIASQLPGSSAENRATPKDATLQDETPAGTANVTLNRIEDRMRSNQHRAYGELQPWIGQQKDLSSPVTNYLKTSIRRVVLNGLDMSGWPLNLGSGLIDQHFNHELHIHVEGTRTSQGDPTEAIIRVQRDPATAVALSGLIIHDAALQPYDPDEDQHRQALAQMIEEWTRDTAAALSQLPSEEASVAVEGLLASSMMLGSCAGAKHPRDYLISMFCEHTIGRNDAHSFEWRDVVAQAREIHLRLRPTVEAYFGESRGRTGGVRALRADQILPCIRSELQRLEGGHLHSHNAPLNRFLRMADSAVNGEWDSLCKRAREAAPLLESNQPLDKQVERVRELAEAALRAGRSGTFDIAALGNISEEALRALREVTAAVGTECSLVQRIEIISGTMPNLVLAARDFVQQASALMDEIDSDLANRASDSSASDQLVTTVSDIEQELANLLDVAGLIAR